jgi:hypothetical protein
MMKRKDGDVHPGIKWGKFTIRIPGVHVGFSLPEMIQGGLITTATGGVLAAVVVHYFGVPFEVAWSVMVFQLFWLMPVSNLLFGEPYAPGAITPAIPLVLAYLAGFGVGVPAIHAATALTLCLCAILLFFGVTGLGARFFQWVPTELRAAIIFGGAIAAFDAEFARLEKLPYTLPVVWTVVFVLMFSVWFNKAKMSSKLLNFLGSMALLVGFIVAAIVGPIFGELSFDIKMGFQVPLIGEFLKSVHPFFVGWPAMDMYLKACPLALVIYIFVFGDLVLGSTLVEQAGEVRKDEKIEIDNTKSHIVLFVRNLGHLLTAGPYIPLHGPLWTGIHVFLTERYKGGRKNMESFYTGLFNWYWPAFFLILLTPVVTFMKPLLPVALSITLILTGFACAYTAMSMVKKPASQGYAFFVGMVIAKVDPVWGLGVGIALYLLILKNFSFGAAKQEIAAEEIAAEEIAAEEIAAEA